MKIRGRQGRGTTHAAARRALQMLRRDLNPAKGDASDIVNPSGSSSGSGAVCAKFLAAHVQTIPALNSTTLVGTAFDFGNSAWWTFPDTITPDLDGIYLFTCGIRCQAHTAPTAMLTVRANFSGPLNSGLDGATLVWWSSTTQILEMNFSGVYTVTGGLGMGVDILNSLDVQLDIIQGEFAVFRLAAA